MKTNPYFNSIPQDVLKEAMCKLAETQALLEPYIRPTGKNERKHPPKMENKSLAFMEKPKEFAQANPERCPSYYTASEFIEDFKEAHNLWTLRNFVMQLYQKLNDTLTLAGNQSYQKALKFYDTAKMTARQNVPGTRAVHEELKVRFPGRSRKAPPDENIQES